MDDMDRISQLPEPILQHILSFLVVKDAVRISVLSKNWNNACATLQFLNFGDQSFFPSRAKFNEDQDIFCQKIRELLNVVDSMIMKRQQNSADIQRFCLQLPNCNHQLLDLKPYINKFLVSLTKENIQELVFKVGDCQGKPWYRLPEAVYGANSLNKLNLGVYDANSLNKLTLGGFNLEYSPSDGMIKLHSLRELYLSRTHVDKQLFQLLMSSCPELEKLDIDYLYGLDHVRIFGLLKLVSVRLYNCHRNLNKIEIEAPNLEYLCHHGLGMLFVVNVAACRNLKAVTFHSLIINDKWVADLFSESSLEKLSLVDCWGLKTVSISSNRLKELSLLSCRSLVKVEVNAPNLSSFSYAGDVSLSISLEALAMKNMYFGIQSKTCESEWHDKLVEFLGNFNHSRIMKMSSRKIIAEFSYETSTDGEEDTGCASVPSKFGWQSLKKVKFENFQDVEDQWKLKNYFIENGKMSESIEGLIG